MKKITKFALLGALTVTLTALTACNTNSDNKIQKEGRLSIVYYPGGYGTEYLNTFCKEFLAQKLNKSVDEIVEGEDYKLVPDEDITYSADYYLTSDARCPDLIISNLLSPKAVTQGYVTSLDDVFDSEVETSNGKQKIGDFVMEEAIDQYTYELRRGQTAKHRFAMPWTAIPISIAYNNTLLKSLAHVDIGYHLEEGAIGSHQTWERAPITVEELKAIFYDLDIYNQEHSTNLAKFGWAAVNGTNWFESLITTWWAQKQGVNEEYSYAGEGSYYDFWKYENPEIFKQTGIQDALQTIKELLIKDGEYANSYNSVGSMTIKNAQQAFAEGKALFCLTGDFFEKEYESFIQQSGQEFKMMRVPSIEGALQKDGKVVNLTYLNISSCAYVPSKGANKDLAKEFLKFTSSEENIMRFAGMTGGIRPFSCDVRNYSEASSFSSFKKSVFDLYYDADDYLVKYPRNTDIEDITPIYLYEGVSENIFCGANYFTVISSLKTMTPKQIMVDGSGSFDSVYTRAVKAFKEWKRLYDL